MNHLTIDEIIEFVSASKLDSETVSLITTVNQHIRKCSKCLRLVQAFQLVYDEFVQMSGSGEFKNYFYNVIEKEKEGNFLELEEAISEYRGFR